MAIAKASLVKAQVISSEIAEKVTKGTKEGLKAAGTKKQAVDLMEAFRINQVLVTDSDGTLVGALHIHDLTRAKVI